MQLEPIATEPPLAFDLARWAKLFIEGLIRIAADEPSEMKARIMIAWEAGVLTSEEAEDWIVLAGLENA